MSVTARLDLSEYAVSLAVLKRPAVPLVRALNRSALSGQTLAVRAISKDTGMKIGDVKRYVTTTQATPTRLVATVRASAERVPLIRFRARGPEPSRRRPGGVTAKLTGGRGRYPHAFIATVAAGSGGSHRGVFERNGFKRLPIRELFGPSLWQAFQKHQAAVTVRVEEQLGKNVAHEMSYALSR